MTVSITPSLQDSVNYAKEKGEKTLRARGNVCNLMETVSLRYKADAHMNSQKL